LVEAEVVRGRNAEAVDVAALVDSLVRLQVHKIQYQKIQSPQIVVEGVKVLGLHPPELMLLLGTTLMVAEAALVGHAPALKPLI
jgi:hypothetical protein